MSDLLKIHEIRLLNARKIMKDSGLDRTQFAEKIGMSYNLLSQYIGKNPKKISGMILLRRLKMLLINLRVF